MPGIVTLTNQAAPGGRRSRLLLLALLLAALAASLLIARVFNARTRQERAAREDDSFAALPPDPPPLPRPDPSAWREEFSHRPHISASPKATEALEAANAYRSVGDIEGARTVLEHAHSLYPKDADVTLSLADVNRGLLRVRQARTLYLSIVETEPGRVEPYAGLAGLALTQGRHEEAWRWLHRCEAALSSRAPSTQAWLALASAYTAQNDSETAEALLRRVVGKAPDSVAARTQLASLLLTSGKVSEAEPVCEAVLSVRPDSVTSSTLLAACLTSAANPRPDFARARQLLERVLEVSPTDRGAYLAAGLVYRHFGLNRLAAQMFDSVVRLDPLSVDGRYELGEVYGLLGLSKLSREQLASSALLRSHARRLDALYVTALNSPFDPAAHLALAREFEDTGRYADAFRECQIAASLRPDDQARRSAQVKLSALLRERGAGKP